MHHVLIYGSDHLAFRIIEQLSLEGCAVSVIAAPGSWLANVGQDSAGEYVRSAAFLWEQGTETTVLKAAHVDQVKTLFAVGDRDEKNLGIALAALELNPGLRVVLRQFNVRLGRLLEQYLPRCEVMSLSTLAAPTFALAAIAPGVRFAHNLGGDTFVLRESLIVRQTTNAWQFDSEKSRVVLALEGETLHWFPSVDRVFGGNTKLLIASTEHELPAYPRLAQHRSVARSPLSWRTQRVLFGVVGYLAFVVLCASLYFSIRLGISALDAVYFVITTITSVGFGDFSLREADGLSKIVGILLMISGVGITAVFFALITNRLVARQRAFEQGRVRQRVSDHTIVCGLGVVGLRVAERLQQQGVPVVCVEKAEDNRFLAEARRRGIPVVVGDALQEQTLRYANIAQARSLVVCSNPDHLNLEIALNARSLREGLPIVLRMFDPDLARRVAHHFKLGTTFSSAAIVAARFAAHATGSTRLFNLQFHDLSLDFHQVSVSQDEEFASLSKRHDGKLLAAVDASGRLHFDVQSSEQMKPDSILIVATLRHDVTA